MIAIYILSFQGPDGGLTFPMNGISLVWFRRVFSGGGIVDIAAACKHSLELGLVVTVLTVLLSVSSGGPVAVIARLRGRPEMAEARLNRRERPGQTRPPSEACDR